MAGVAGFAFAVPVGAEEFSYSRCLVTGNGSGASPSMTRVYGYAPSRELACLKAAQEYEAKRSADQALERERRRQADAEAQRLQMEVEAQQAVEQSAAKEQSRARDEAARARMAEEAEDARQRRIRREAELSRPEAPPPAAQQVLPGPCVTADLTAKCAMLQDPVLEQIRKSQENAVRGRPSR